MVGVLKEPTERRLRLGDSRLSRAILSRHQNQSGRQRDGEDDENVQPTLLELTLEYSCSKSRLWSLYAPVDADVATTHYFGVYFSSRASAFLPSSHDPEAHDRIKRRSMIASLHYQLTTSTPILLPKATNDELENES